VEPNELQNIIAKQMQELSASFFGVNPTLGIIQVILLALVLAYLYIRFIRGTNSENLVRGVFALVLMWFLSEILIKFNVIILGVFLKTTVTVVTFGLIVIFQPELRKFLGYIGQGHLIKRILKKEKKENKKADVVKELIETIKYLSKFKIGGLIVILPNLAAGNFSDVGTKINADVSQELLLTIFHPKTPLHDGAVVILEDKILSAGVLLPLTEDPKLSWRYGTRHRAAIGVSEVSECACIVISEETGEVSIAMDGVLKKYEDLGNLKTAIERILGHVEVEEAPKMKLNFDKVLTKPDSKAVAAEGQKTE